MILLKEYFSVQELSGIQHIADSKNCQHIEISILAKRANSLLHSAHTLQ